MTYRTSLTIFTSSVVLVACHVGVVDLGEGDAGPGVGSSGSTGLPTNDVGAPNSVSNPVDTGASQPGPTDTAGSATASSELLTSADDNTPINLGVGGPLGGSWWTFHDKGGSTTEPDTTFGDELPFALGGHRDRAAAIRFMVVPEPTFDTIGSVKWFGRDAAGGFEMPNAGLGFSLRKRNAPYSIPLDKAGIKFWAKGDGASVAKYVTVAFPTADTDVAVKDDAFYTSCTCSDLVYPSDPVSCLQTNGARIESDFNGGNNTCFAHFRLGVKLTQDWQQYAVLFRDLHWADEDPATGELQAYPWVDRKLLSQRDERTNDPVGWNRARVTKVTFSAYKPQYDEPRAEGSLWLDDVAWVTTSDGITQSGALPSR